MIVVRRVIFRDIPVEELIKKATFKLLVSHTLATSGVLVVLMHLKGIETWHEAGSLLRSGSNGVGMLEGYGNRVSVV